MSRTFVAGTAGHVDHGKSALVRVLTGTDPDRLAEEQLRHMTIDLGFAELTTPAGNRVHLVDVPGHERFVRNMLAGAAGIDAAILTIAADDGPMPQTREHLAILDLLGIEHGVVALSKSDLVDDEWRAFVVEATRDLLDGTSLAGAEIVPVSSVTGEGLDELRSALDRALAPIERQRRGSFPRLPIDRVFSLSGFGTVVTGTLLDAPLRIGDRVEILPGGLSSRVRGMQTFGKTVELAEPGSRVAVNVTGLETSELARGDVLTYPDAMRPAMRLDIRVQILESSERPLAHNDEVILFAGSSETPAKVALLDRDAIEPGEAGLVQLRLARPVAVEPRDRFILRRPSPPETIGGGVVLELDAARHKRFQPAVIDRLHQLNAGDPADALLAWLGNRFVSEQELRTQGPAGVAGELLAAGRIKCVGPVEGRICAATSSVQTQMERMQVSVDTHHVRFPLEPGIAREALRQELGLDRPVFDALLTTSEVLEETRAHVRRVGFRIQLEAAQQEQADRYLSELRHAGFQPPTPDEFGLQPEVARALIAMDILMPVGEGIVFLPEQLDEAEARLLTALAAGGSISLAEYRDLLGTSRKYTQALLEYFDHRRLTRRVGDRRVSMRPLQQRESNEPA